MDVYRRQAASSGAMVPAGITAASTIRTRQNITTSKDVDYISGAAILLSTALWKQIGGFDERFAPAYCEDSDLAFEVRKAGYRVV